MDGDRVEQLLEEILVELRALNDVTVWAANPRDLGRSWTAEKRDEVLARKREYMREQLAGESAPDGTGPDEPIGDRGVDQLTRSVVTSVPGDSPRSRASRFSIVTRAIC